MARPYKPIKSRSAGQYVVDEVRDHKPVIRENKAAAGAMYTSNRSGHLTGLRPLLGVATGLLNLIATGTMAPRSVWWLKVTRNPCPCCGHKSGKLRLSESGKKELRRARIRRNMRKDEQWRATQGVTNTQGLMNARPQVFIEPIDRGFRVAAFRLNGDPIPHSLGSTIEDPNDDWNLTRYTK
jgi:hypothetical protein